MGWWCEIAPLERQALRRDAAAHRWVFEWGGWFNEAHSLYYVRALERRSHNTFSCARSVSGWMRDCGVCTQNKNNKTHISLGERFLHAAHFPPRTTGTVAHLCKYRIRIFCGGDGGSSSSSAFSYKHLCAGHIIIRYFVPMTTTSAAPARTHRPTDRPTTNVHHVRLICVFRPSTYAFVI